MTRNATPGERLSLALADALTRGLIVPCIGQAERFTSDDPADLKEAARECDECPLIAECATASEAEQWGAWAGRVVMPSWQSGRRKKESAA